MKTYRVELTDDELRAVIHHHARKIVSNNIHILVSKRIHDLAKRLETKETSSTTEDWN
jgi:hypothetical protein